MSDMRTYSLQLSAVELIKNALLSSPAGSATTSQILFSSWQLINIPAFDLARSKFSDDLHFEVRALCSRLIYQAQDIERTKIAGLLSRENVDYVFVKAIELQLENQHWGRNRCGWDIDLGIPLERAERAFATLASLGYKIRMPRRSVGPFRDIRQYETAALQRLTPISPLDGDRYRQILEHLALFPDQLPMRVIDGKIEISVDLDIHIRSFHHVPIEIILENRRIVNRDGVDFSIPSVRDMLALYIVKIYFECSFIYKHGVQLYYDLAVLWSSASEADRMGALDVASGLNCEIPAFFVIRRLESNFGIRFSERVSRVLSEFSIIDERSPLARNDYGDHWYKFIGRMVNDTA